MQPGADQPYPLQPDCRSCATASLGRSRVEPVDEAVRIKAFEFAWPADEHRLEWIYLVAKTYAHHRVPPYVLKPCASFSRVDVELALSDDVVEFYRIRILGTRFEVDEPVGDEAPIVDWLGDDRACQGSAWNDEDRSTASEQQ